MIDSAPPPGNPPPMSLAEDPGDKKYKTCRTLAILTYRLNSVSDLGTGHTGTRSVHARQLAQYLANTSLSMSYEAIAVVSGQNRATVLHSVERVEDRRENSHFDVVVTALETLLGLLGTLETADLLNVEGSLDPEASEGLA